MLLSKSRILTFLQCPKKFYYTQIEKLPIKENIWIIRGGNFHKFAELFWKDVKVEGNQLILPEIPDMMDDYVDNAIKNFINNEKKRWETCLKRTDNPKKYFFPVMLEKKVVNEKLQIDGIVDRVDQNQDGSFVIIEYKVQHPRRSWKLLFELSFYKYLIEQTHKDFEGKINTGVVYFPTHNDFWLINNLNVDGIEKTIEDIKSSIIENRFEGKVWSQCANCQFQSKCFVGD